MKELDKAAFIHLFKEACKKCFGATLTVPLSETESKHLGNAILDATGLVIGAKSIKNYSSYVLQPTGTRTENPSPATLDTLARYVLDAPYSDELQRKEREAHFPWWFRYKSSLSFPEQTDRRNSIGKKQVMVMGGVLAIIILIILVIVLPSRPKENFTDDFHALSDDSLQRRGWFLKDKDALWWDKRNIISPGLTLYTLRGDNWPDSVNAPSIKNLLIRKLPFDCFATEIHLEDFVPRHDWQQAGILLLEDTLFAGKSIRLSIAYNDFFGGFAKPKEVILQAVASGGKDLTKPEEIAHYPLFSIEPGQETLVENNLKRSALRIEKNGVHFRFLYSSGSIDNLAFKEAFSKDLSIHPKYIAIFALQGFVPDSNYTPAHIKFFNLSKLPCN